MLAVRMLHRTPALIRLLISTQRKGITLCSAEQEVCVSRHQPIQLRFLNGAFDFAEQCGSIVVCHLH